MKHLHGSEFAAAKVEAAKLLSQSSWPYARQSCVDSAPCLLSQIPPERVGLNGEYDHAGLAKRVRLVLQQKLGKEVVAQLDIAQRGKVVVFHGTSLDARFIRQITHLALALDGADFVEVFDRTTMTRRVA
jgi:hypothetical protein